MASERYPRTPAWWAIVIAGSVMLFIGLGNAICDAVLSTWGMGWKAAAVAYAYGAIGGLWFMRLAYLSVTDDATYG